MADGGQARTAPNTLLCIIQRTAASFISSMVPITISLRLYETKLRSRRHLKCSLSLRHRQRYLKMRHF